MDHVRIGPPASQPIAEPAWADAPAQAQGGGGFFATLKEAIAKANDIQIEANRQVEALMTGQSDNVHRTMVALQQADLSFQLMMQIRNKLIAAYEEIQRMQI